MPRSGRIDEEPAAQQMRRSELSIYNSLSRKQDRVEGDPSIGLYVCGITPYDTTHLGHAFTYTAFDVLVRYLRFLGHRVTYVQNITDVDDDILLRAAAIGVDWKELGNGETRKYMEDMKTLNNLPPDVMPRATEHIQDMIKIVEGLLEKGLAYEKEGNVYFHVRSAPDFGKLCPMPYQAQLDLANERGNFPDDPLKQDPLDFVLWQAKKEGEPYWLSPWSEGRPGWHIECSAMSMKYLGESFAIHGGGEDLMFPHNECEIAQSEHYTGRPFVRYWMHTGMVYCRAKKMSKSLGNMIFLSDLAAKYAPDVVRLYLLSHHYRGSWNYDPRGLEVMNSLAQRFCQAASDVMDADEEDLSRWAEPFLVAMARDLDTPRSIQELRRLADERDSSAARALRTLGGSILGLGFSPDAATRTPSA